MTYHATREFDVLKNTLADALLKLRGQLPSGAKSNAWRAMGL